MTQSPVDESLVANVALGTQADIDAVAKAAKVAFPAWAALPGDQRKTILQRIAQTPAVAQYYAKFGA